MWSVNDLDSHANLSHVNLPLPTVLRMLPRDEFIPSSNIDIGPDKGNILFFSDAFISSIKQKTVHTTRTPTLEGGFNVSSKSWIGLLSKNASFMVKHLKPPKCPQDTSQRLPKLKYFSLTTWRFNMLPTVQSWAWRGESVDVLAGRILEKGWNLRHEMYEDLLD